jgi:hypothetical protein
MLATDCKSKRLVAASAGLVATVSLAWTLAGSTEARSVSAPPPKPTITITKPKDGARINDKSVVVTGRYVSDEDPNFIRVNHVALVPAQIHDGAHGGWFRTRVRLGRGRNRITAEIVLRGGIKARDTIHVTGTHKKPLPHRLLFVGRHKPRVQFDAHTKHNKIKKLTGFRVDKVPSCVALDLKDTIKVHHRRFSHAETLNIEEGVHVKVRGRFSANGKRASGTASVSGACNYPKHHWKAKGSPSR